MIKSKTRLKTVAAPAVPQARDEFVDLRYESIAVTFGLLGDLMDEAVPNLIWRKQA